MSAFDDSDFGWSTEGRHRRTSDDRKRRRSRSRSRRRRDERQDKRRHRSRSPRSRSRSPDGGSRLRDGGRDDSRVTVVRRFPFDLCTAPSRDWWCSLCSNPNPVQRWDCGKCGSLHTPDGSALRPSTELMSDFVSSQSIEGMAAAALRGEYSDLPHATMILLEMYWRERSHDAQRKVLHELVQSVIRVRPECNSLLMYEALIDDAVNGSDDSPNAVKGFVVCMRFFAIPHAKQFLLTTQSSIALPGFVRVPPFGMQGRLRFGFTTRRNVPKPPSTQIDAPILDIHEEQPATEAPTRWVPPVFQDDVELRAYLVKLFDEWSTLIPEQRTYYEANIGKVQQFAPTTVTTAPTVITTNAARSVVDPAAIKKKLEEKRQALEALKKQQQTPIESATTVAIVAPLPTTAAGPTSVLERLALKRAQLQQKQSTIEASTVVTPSSLPISNPALSSLINLFPLPPNFPTKTDYTRQVKCVNPRVMLTLQGIPMDVSSRVLNGKFL